jgi:type II secretory pathway pseudopilin PulG
MVKSNQKKQPRLLGGYTIVESMIFLAVTGAMVMAVMILIGGQQGKTQFQQTVREFEVVLQDIANDVSTGYANIVIPPGRYCSYDLAGTTASISTTVPVNRCIFVGRTVQFGISGDAERYGVYAVVGKQRTASGQEVTSLTTAQAAAQIPNTGYTGEVKQFGSGIRVLSARYHPTATPSGSDPTIDAIGFFTTFQSYSSGSISSGSINVNISPITGANPSTRDQSALRTAMITQINSATAPTWDSKTNPLGGMSICLQSGTSKQRALIRMGGNGASPASITTIIGGDTTCA